MALIDKSRPQILDKNKIVNPIISSYTLSEDESGSICTNTAFTTGVMYYYLPTITAGNVGTYFTFIPTTTNFVFQILGLQGIQYQSTSGDLVISATFTNGGTVPYNKYAVLEVQAVEVSTGVYTWIVTKMMGRWVTV